MKPACLPVLLLFLLPWPGAAAQQQDAFDTFNESIDSRFSRASGTVDARYEAVRTAIDRAFKGLTRKIEVQWGEDSQMPSKKRWVTYNDSMNARVTVDYDAGELVVEAVLDGALEVNPQLQEMARFAGELLQADVEQLNARDSLLREINAELAAEQLDVEPPARQATGEPQTSFLAAVLPIPEIEKQLLNLDSETLQDQEVQEVPEANAPEVESPTETVASETLASPAMLQLVEVSGITRLKVSFPFVSAAQQRLLESNLGTVREYSTRYDVPVSVILAIIETESSFNPRAVSPIPAFGLMQLVPGTAGVDAYQKVYGEKKILSAEFLFDEKNNIELGTAYLNLVSEQYLGHIENPASRFYCTLAAYNTGVGNLAKTFTGTSNLNSAARRINRMDDSEVFALLLEKLPAQETRDYLQKILARVENYKHLDVEPLNEA